MALNPVFLSRLPISPAWPIKAATAKIAILGLEGKTGSQ
jgi:hypothetical protein